MRYVSEKTLDEIIEQGKCLLKSGTLNIEELLRTKSDVELFEMLKDHFEDIPDEKLRPMIDAPRDGKYILAQVDDEYEQARWNTHWGMWVFHDDLMIEDDRLKGWIPIPKVSV